MEEKAVVISDERSSAGVPVLTTCWTLCLSIVAPRGEPAQSEGNHW